MRLIMKSEIFELIETSSHSNVFLQHAPLILVLNREHGDFRFAEDGGRKFCSLPPVCYSQTHSLYHSGMHFIVGVKI